MSDKIRIKPDDLQKLIGTKPKVIFESGKVPLAATRMNITLDLVEKIRGIVSQGNVYVECSSDEYQRLLDHKDITVGKRARDIQDKALQSISDVFARIDECGYIDLDVFSHLQAALSEQVKVLLADEYLAKMVVNTLEYDTETHNHCVGVNILGTLFADYLNHLPFGYRLDVDMVAAGALLHDVGKTKVPHDILKADRRLTDEEFELIKMHTLYGKEILEKGKLSAEIIDMAYRHHQRPNGGGYPPQAKTPDLPEAVKVISMVDMYQALRAKRCYKPGFDIERAIKILEDDAGRGAIDSRIWGHFKGFLWKKTSDGQEYFRKNGYVF